jgi:hypothetical protein
MEAIVYVMMYGYPVVAAGLGLLVLERSRALDRERARVAEADPPPRDLPDPATLPAAYGALAHGEWHARDSAPDDDWQVMGEHGEHEEAGPTPA